MAVGISGSCLSKFIRIKMSNNEASIVIAGASGVGKSHLLRRWLGRNLLDYRATFDHEETLKADGLAGKIDLQFLDTGGNEEAGDWDEWLSFKTAHVLVFDVEDKTSFTRLQEVYGKIKEEHKSVIIIVGNNRTNAKEGQVSPQEGKEWANELHPGCHYLEVCTQDGSGTQEALSQLIALCMAAVSSSVSALPVVEDPSKLTVTDLYSMIVTLRAHLDQEQKQREALEKALDNERRKTRTLAKSVHALLTANVVVKAKAGIPAVVGSPSSAPRVDQNGVGQDSVAAVLFDTPKKAASKSVAAESQQVCLAGK